MVDKAMLVPGTAITASQGFIVVPWSSASLYDNPFVFTPSNLRSKVKEGDHGIVIGPTVQRADGLRLSYVFFSNGAVGCCNDKFIVPSW